MSLISLVNAANFFAIMRLARCEYSKYVSSVLEAAYPEHDVALTGGGC